MSKARTAAFNAVRFACRLQIIARRLREAKNNSHQDLEAALLGVDGNGLGADVERTPDGMLSRVSRVQGTSPTAEGAKLNPETVGLLVQAIGAADQLASQNVFMSDASALLTLVRSSWISTMLIFCPLGIMSKVLGWGATPTFFLNFLVLAPLAMTLGDVTEDLALRMGDVAGGLLNASFGNVTELVLSIAALRQGLLDVVSDSLLGSILSNLLLVLGCSFLVGGLLHKTQKFNAASNRTYGSLLFLSCIGIAIPTAAAGMISDPDRPNMVLWVSRGTAIVLLICYVAYLVFQLGTHKHLFSESCVDDEEEELVAEPELPVISVTGGVVALAAISALVAVHSEFLTQAIEDTSSETGISTGFLAVIVLPIAGNACEHITAVMVAAKDKMDLSLGIAIGSSLQIALFAIPLMVLLGWVLGQPMSLDYEMFSALALVLSVIHANLVNADATSNWLMGVQLIATYILVALVYFFK